MHGAGVLTYSFGMRHGVHHLDGTVVLALSIVNALLTPVESTCLLTLTCTVLSFYHENVTIYELVISTVLDQAINNLQVLLVVTPFS